LLFLVDSYSAKQYQKHKHPSVVANTGTFYGIDLQTYQYLFAFLSSINVGSLSASALLIN